MRFSFLDTLPLLRFWKLRGTFLPPFSTPTVIAPLTLGKHHDGEHGTGEAQSIDRMQYVKVWSITGFVTVYKVG